MAINPNMSELFESSFFWGGINLKVYLSNNLRDFNEVFRKDVTYDNIKS